MASPIPPSCQVPKFPPVSRRASTPAKRATTNTLAKIDKRAAVVLSSKRSYRHPNTDPTPYLPWKILCCPRDFSSAFRLPADTATRWTSAAKPPWRKAIDSWASPNWRARRPGPTCGPHGTRRDSSSPSPCKAKRSRVWCRASRPEDSDGLQLWIDTRDVHNVHRAGRFCQRLIFLPSGDGAATGPAGGHDALDQSRPGTACPHSAGLAAGPLRPAPGWVYTNGMDSRRSPDRLRPR